MSESDGSGTAPRVSGAVPAGSGGGDIILRGILRDRSVRVVAAVTTAVAREAARRHGAVGGAAAALGRAGTAGLLLATLTKGNERVTVQLVGGGPMGEIIVDAKANGDVRIYARHPGVAVPALPGTRVVLGKTLGPEGVVRVARDLGLKELVSGQTAFVDGEIDTDIEGYLTESEQIVSALGCETLLNAELDVAQSGGVLVQTLPGSDALADLEVIRRRFRDGSLSRGISQAPRELTAEQLARLALGELAEELAILDVRPVRFECPCSKDRAASTLALLGASDLAALALEPEGASVTCEFCRNEHKFTPDELERLSLSQHAGRASG